MSRTSRGIAITFSAAVLLLAFQNCSQTVFSNTDLNKLTANSVASYVTKEDTSISADLVKDKYTLSSQTQIPSTFSLTQQTGHGRLDFDSSKATFTYTPNENFYGADQFVIAELQEGSKSALSRTVMIKVQSVNDLPVIKTDSLNFDMNSTNSPVILVLEDIDDPSVITGLSADGALNTLKTPNGQLDRRSGQIYYTPNQLYRGAEQVDFYAIDGSGGVTKKTISLVVGNPFRDFKPALAIRASGCVSCHANVNSPFVTDLGFGNTWFAATNSPKRWDAPTQTLSFTNGNMYGDHGRSWATANISGPIVVPKTPAIDVGLSAPMTLAQYFTSQEQAKQAAPPNGLASYTPAVVNELNTVSIRAPTVAQLELRFKIDGTVGTKFIANDSSSPALSGIIFDNAGYYKNSGTVVCDGDLFLRGTVFLNKPVIRTKNGCRIHAAGPIFVQENPSYENLGAGTAANNTNLQLVSARAIIMGIGLSHCETAGWYKTTGIANPLWERMQNIWTVTSHVSRIAADPRAEGAYIVAEAGKLSGYKDASCYAGGREVNVERLLLNAPMVQSRLQGNVRGVVVTEVALFALSRFAYSFDDVFTRVPVLPLLDPSEFLIVK